MIYLFSLTLPIQDPVLIFSIVLFIILLAPILLNRVKVPGIMGLIIAGIVIGPNGFNLLERDSSIVLFGTVGLLYIMFLAGLELDMNDFKKNKNKSIVFGTLTFLFPLALGIPVCYYLLDYERRYPAADCTHQGSGSRVRLRRYRSHVQPDAGRIEDHEDRQDLTCRSCAMAHDR